MGKKSQKKNQMKKDNSTKNASRTKRVIHKPQTIA